MTSLTRREQTSIEYTTGLLVTRFQNDNQQATIDRLTRLMDEAGIPDKEDFESRAAYVIGYYQSVQEMRKCNNQNQ